MARRHAVLALASALLTIAPPGDQSRAADLGSGPRERRTPDYGTPPLMEVQRWSGFYLGATGGYSFGQADGDIGSVSFDHDGWAATVLAGYNWQIGAAVLGVEADIGTGDFGTNTSTGLGKLGSELNWFSSLRARAGYLVTPSLLLYATAGVAWADMEFTLAGSSASETFFGYQVGGGAELALTPRSSLRLEYIYTDLDSESLSHGGLSTTFDPDFHTVRAGFAFKF
jgi:outer membrane immunogenic protein